MLLTGFQCKRVGYLYGRWVDDDEGNAGVQARPAARGSPRTGEGSPGSRARGVRGRDHIPMT